MKRYEILVILIVCLVTCICITKFDKSFALPEDDTIIEAYDELDVAEYSKASNDTSFYTIDTLNGKVSDGKFTDFGGDSYKSVISGASSNNEKKELVKDYLLDSGLYGVDDNNNSKLDVVRIYSNKRVRVNTKKSDINNYGAKNGVFYKDYYLFEYDTDEDTKNAYDSFIKEYGSSNVMLDLPVKMNEAKGWGYSFMKFDYKLINEKLYSGNPIIVAVLDSGINEAHEIFSNTNILEGANMIDSTKSTRDDDGHGTMVSGIIAESTTSNVSILPIKVLDENGNGSLFDVFNGLCWAEKQGARIANLSFGVDYSKYVYSSEYITEIHDMINTYEYILSLRNLLMISASGNENKNSDTIYSYPGVSKHTISVGSINENETRSYYSNFGSSLDFVAPGEDVLVANYKNNSLYKTSSGTSFSVPYIVSAASNILSEYPNYSNTTVKNYLINISKDLGESGKDIYYGYGVPIFKEDDSSFTDENFIENYNLKLSSTHYTYDGTYKKPNITIFDKNNKLLDPSNYKVVYSNNLKAGTANIKVTGTGKYYGTINQHYIINKDNINNSSIKVNSKYAYTGKSIKPRISVTRKSRVINNKDYSISYKSNKSIGTASIAVTGKNNYLGTKTLKFKIVPKKVLISSIKGKKNRVVVKLKKMSPSPTFYEVKYKKYNSNKWTIKKVKNRSITIKKLKRNTTYKIKIRAVKTVNGKNYKGSYSKTYKVTTS